MSGFPSFQPSRARPFYVSDVCIGGDINDTERTTFARFGITSDDDSSAFELLAGMPERVQATMMALGVDFNQACYELSARIERVELSPRAELYCMQQLFASPAYIAEHDMTDARAKEYIHTAPEGCDHVCAYADSYTGQILFYHHYVSGDSGQTFFTMSR